MGFDTSYIINNILKTEDDETIRKLNRLIELQTELLRAQGVVPTENNRLTQELLRTDGIKVLYPLQELSGDVAVDYASGSDGLYDKVILGKAGASPNIPRTVGFNDVGKVYAGAEASVKGLSTYTIVAVVNLLDNSKAQNIWVEPVSNLIEAVRLQLGWNFKAQKLTVGARSGKSTQPFQSVTTSAIVPSGFCILHVTVDIANNAIALYRNGVQLDTVGAVDFGGALNVENTLPIESPALGGHSDLNNIQRYSSDAAFFALIGRKITQDEITRQAREAGFVV